MSISPSDLAIIDETDASPVMFTTVLSMSRILSTGKMIAIHAGFKPTDCNTMIIIINPALGTAAAPMEAKVAVKTMANCCVILRSIICN